MQRPCKFCKLSRRKLDSTQEPAAKRQRVLDVNKAIKVALDSGIGIRVLAHR